MSTTKTKAETVRFYSKVNHLRLVRKARRRKHNPDGEYIGTTEGVTYEFHDGVLELEVGQDVLPDGPDGDDQDAVDWMRRHKQYQSGDFGFHEVGAEPDRVPDPTGTLREIARAAAVQDRGELEAILAAEGEGHMRESVLVAARAAIDALGDGGNGADG